MAEIKPHPKKETFLKKWFPLEPYGPSFRKNAESDLDELLSSVCAEFSDAVVKKERQRITRELKRIFSVDVDKVVNGE